MLAAKMTNRTPSASIVMTGSIYSPSSNWHCEEEMQCAVPSAVVPETQGDYPRWLGGWHVLNLCRKQARGEGSRLRHRQDTLPGWLCARPDCNDHGRSTYGANQIRVPFDIHVHA